MFIERQRKYIMGEIVKHDRPGDKEFLFWHNIKLIVKQLAGLYAGYKAKVRQRGVQSTEALTMDALWMINMDGDIIQLESAFNKGFLSQTARMSFRETSRKNMIRSRKVAAKNWKNLLLKSLSHKFDYTAAEKIEFKRSIEALWKKKVLKQRCSALVRLTDNNDDVMVAHTSWEVSFARMSRSIVDQG